jgi:hypothetical protein
MSEELSNPVVTESDIVEIRRLHDGVVSHALTALQMAIDAGGKLFDAKGKCKHGEWLPFLEKVGINARTAQRYVKLYENRERLAFATDVSRITDAYQFLADASDRYYAVCPKCGAHHECLVLKQKH